jgi:hypothetical protein
VSHPTKIPAALGELAARARRVAEALVNHQDRSALIDTAKGLEISAAALEAAETRAAGINASLVEGRAEMLRELADQTGNILLWEHLLATAALLENLADLLRSGAVRQPPWA